MIRKTCTKCFTSKERETNYYKSHGYKDGYQNICKACRKNFPSQDVYHKCYILRRRNAQYVWDYLKQNPCLDCNETNPIVLQFDHRDGVDKKDIVSKLVHNTSSLKVIQNEIDKCDVRCANCHFKRTALQQGWHKYIQS